MLQRRDVLGQESYRFADLDDLSLRCGLAQELLRHILRQVEHGTVSLDIVHHFDLPHFVGRRLPDV
jgi:hypothetical protein